MKILKKYVSILLITAMMFTSPFSVWANTTDISTEKVVNSVKNSYMSIINWSKIR